MPIYQILRPVYMGTYVIAALQLFTIISGANIERLERSLQLESMPEQPQVNGRSILSVETQKATNSVQPTLLIAEGNHNHPTPQQWSALNNGKPIDFRPYGPKNILIRVTRLENAATINPDQIYNLNLECLYELFNLTAHTRRPVLPAKSIICNPDILGFVLSSESGELHEIAVSTIDEAFESIQELTHHLSVQEMDFDIYDTTDTGSEPKYIAQGCLAYRGCGQTPNTVPSNLTLKANPATSIYVPPTYPDVQKDTIFVPQPQAAPIPLVNFADVATVYYRALFTRLFSLPASSNLTMPTAPGFRRHPPLHATQLWEGNHYNYLVLVFAQDWDSQYVFTLPDIAEIMNFEFRQRLVDGRLRNGARGYFEKEVKGVVPKQPKRTGEFCMWYISSGRPDICGRLFGLDPNEHPGGVTAVA
ncbi:MAG: hypothetical protein Q9170_007828 [Blastenia crenularia]